jgi:hypothetical protein
MNLLRHKEEHHLRRETETNNVLASTGMAEDFLICSG